MSREVVQVGRARTERDGARRYMVVSYSFDFRARSMDLELDEAWDAETKRLHHENRLRFMEASSAEFGSDNLSVKIENLRALGGEPMSVYSVHNDLLRQIRRAFIVGSYYPALVGAVSLGERILNQILLALRDKYFSGHVATSKVRGKGALNDWDLLIRTLTAWGVLSVEVARKFQELKVMRNSSVHFGLTEIHESGGRDEALRAIQLLQEIVDERFGALAADLLIPGTSGFFYLRRSVEADPFVTEFYLPACALLSPRGGFRSLFPLIVEDETEFDLVGEVSDADFVMMTKS